MPLPENVTAGTTGHLTNHDTIHRDINALGFDVHDYGAIGDGLTHPLSSVYGSLGAAQAVYSFATSLSQEIDWCATQAAVLAAEAAGGPRLIQFQARNYRWNSLLQITLPGFRFIGKRHGRFETTAGTQLLCAGTASIQIGTDDGNPYDANEYDGPGSFSLEWMTMRRSDAATLLGNTQGHYAPGSKAIVDWRGGDLNIRHAWIEGWDYAFWGVQSDISEWDDVEIFYCHSGIYLGPRSDQVSLKKIYALFCDRVLDIDGAEGTRIIEPQFVGCGAGGTTLTDGAVGSSSTAFSSATAAFTAGDVGSIIAVTGAGAAASTLTTTIAAFVDSHHVTLATAATTAVSGATFTYGAINPIRIRSSQWTRGSHTIVFDKPWFEQFQGNQNVEAFIEVGILDTIQVTDVVVRDPVVLTNGQGVTPHVTHFIKVDNATRVLIDLDVTTATSNLGLANLILNSGSIIPSVCVRHGNVSGYRATNIGTGVLDLLNISWASNFLSLSQNLGSNPILRIKQVGDANPRVQLLGNGKFSFGDGTAATDADWLRVGAKVMGVTAGGQAVFPGSGTTGQRPASTPDGTHFFDTTLGKPVWAKAAAGTGWVDATGTAV